MADCGNLVQDSARANASGGKRRDESQETALLSGSFLSDLIHHIFYKRRIKNPILPLWQHPRLLKKLLTPAFRLFTSMEKDN